MTTHYGRYQFVPLKASPEIFEFFIESVDHQDNFWLKVGDVSDQDGRHAPAAYLRFTRLGGHIFQLTEVRPGHGPIPIPSISKPQS